MMKILILIFAIFAICYATPMREEILARLGQLSELKDQIAQAKEAFTKFHEVATQTHMNYREIITNSNSKRDARITQECSNALQNLASVYVNGSCPLYFAQYFNPTTSSSDKQTAVSNFCTNCQQPFNQAVNRVITACNFSDIDAAIARAAGFYPRFLCAKDSSNNFCANVLNDVVGNVPTDISQFTDATLVKVCAPCISIALNVLQQGNLVANAVYLKSVIVLRGVCVTFKGKFCFAQIRDNYNGLIQIGAKFNSTNAEITAGDFNKILDFFCAPCYRLISARLALSNGISALAVLKAFSTVGSLCRKNAAKEYCLVKIFDLAKPFLAAGASGGNVPCDNSFKGANATCSDDCKNVVRNFVNKGGCCWAVLADAISGTGPGSDNTLKTQFYAAIKQCVPDITLPEPCVSIAKAKIKITYTNLVLSVIAANQQAFITAALADLRVAIGGYDSVDNANIQVTTNKRAGEVVISVPVTTTGTLGDTLTYSETSCGNVCGSIAIQDPSQQVTVTSSTSDLSVQSSSSVLTFSFALLFILSLFFF